MADPVTLAMVGAAAGAAMKPNDPLKGAMLGATAGYTGGTALGIGGAAGGASAAGGAAAAGGTTAATNSMIAAQSAQPALSYGGGNILAANTANNANLAAMNAGGMSFAGRPPVDPTMLNTASNVSAAPSFMDKISMSGKSAMENPMMTKEALGATNSLLASDQPQMSPAPVVPVTARNKLGAYDPIALLDPYKQSVIGGQQNQMISLI